MYVFGEPVLSAHTIFDYHPAIFESYSKFREDLYFFHHTFHFRILTYTCGSRALFTVSRQQHFVFLVSVHSAAIPPTHTIHFPTSLQLFLSFLCSLSPFPLPCAEVPSSQTTALLSVFYHISHSL